MEAQLKNVLELDDNVPYFITEQGFGKFYIVKKIESFDDGNILFDYDNKNPLIIGEDILEIPNRNIEIVVEYTNDCLISSFTHALRKYADISNYDYVSYEPYFGELITKYLYNKDGMETSKIMPRLFRKIIDN